ncbi:MAG: DNA repair protein RadC [Bacteroidota bacterium]
MTYQHLPITEWALEDRPREKLLHRGIDALTNAELLAILLGSGTHKLSAIDLARNIIEQTGGLKQLGKSSVNELKKIKGIGPAKAISMVAAFELGRRRSTLTPEEIRILSSDDAAAYLGPLLADLRQEVFYLVLLNRNNIVIGGKQIFKGGVHSTIMDPKIVFHEAMNHLACGILVAHNHPSGNLNPSTADRHITHKIEEGCKILDLMFLDHLVISDKGYYSFRDEGYIL